MTRKLVLATLILVTAGLSGHANADESPNESPELLKWYGFFRLDAIYNDSRMSGVQTPQWVELEAEGSDDDAEGSIHPRLTRLGVDIAPKKIGNFLSSGKIEVDFQNGGGEARQLPRLREAYVEFKYEIFEILVGQSWDLISPLNPTANNDTLMWNTGNLADRRPQLRGTVVIPAGGGALRLGAMAGQTGAVDQQDLDGDGRLDGIESSAPTVQGLGEFVRNGMRFGVWGHGGFTTISTPIADIDGFGSWAAGAHVHIPFQKLLWARAEFHRGRNLTDVRGGIGQGVNLTTGGGIRSTGGWAEIGAKIRPSYAIIAGVFVENPDDGDLNDGARELNWAYAISQRVQPHKRVTVGLDYIFWKTDYKNLGSGTANRLNAYLKTSF